MLCLPLGCESGQAALMWLTCVPAPGSPGHTQPGALSSSVESFGDHELGSIYCNIRFIIEMS